MTLSTDFNWFHSGQLGAQQMNGAAGSNGQMLQVLDSCLIDGYNPQTVISATKTAITVTLTYGVSHGYELNQIVLISGANDTVLNAKHRIVSKTSNTITIDAIGVAALTGTMITKVAPLGWQSIFGATTPLKRAYRSNNEQSSKTVLYLDMSYPTSSGYNSANPAKRAMVDLCENMTTLGVQINSYTNSFNNRPTIRNGKMFWYQCRGYDRPTAVNDSENRQWVVVGNDKVFYLFNLWQSFDIAANATRDTFGFGDFDDLQGITTASNCGWIGIVNSNDTDAYYYTKIGASIGGSAPTLTDNSGVMVKRANNTGGLSPFIFATDGAATLYYSGAQGDSTNFPNPATQSVIGLPVYAMTDQNLRARLPALLAIPQNMNNNVAALDRLTENQKLIVSVGSQLAIAGFLALDLGA